MLKRKFYLKLLMSLLLTALTVPQVMADELTVANGTVTNDMVPLYGFYWDTGFKTTMVYPASMLSDMSGGTINSITFYANSETYTALQGGAVKVSLGEVGQTTLSGHLSGLTQVFNGTPVKDGAKCVITFDNPFEYNGGNLAVECLLTSKGSNYPTINFIGTSQTSASYYTYGSSLTNGDKAVDYLAKATFDYDSGVLEDYSAKVSPDEIVFGKVAVDGTKTVNVTLKNNGSNSFSYSLSGLVAPFSTTATNGTLESKSSVEIPVTFNPSAVGTYTGTLSIDCGLAGVKTVELSGNAATEITINEGSATNTYLPLVMPGYYNTQKNQMIYPSDMLSGIVGKKIKGLTFYNQGSNFNGKINVALGSTTQSSYANWQSPITGLTQVATNQSVSEGNELSIVFDDVFEYTGGNLVIQMEVTDKGSNNSYSDASITWIGTTQTTNTGYYNYTGSYNWGAVQQFLPQVTFAFEDSETPATPVITVDPTTVEAFSTEVGTPATATVNVTGENLTGDITASISGDDAFTAVLENGVLTITYNPTAAGNHTATLTLSSEGAKNVTIDLSGTATAPTVPTIAVNPATVNISANPGTTGTATFNVTGSNLEDDAITLAASQGFSVTPATIAVENGSATATVTVAFAAPSQEGTTEGTITLTCGEATATVNVTGKSEEVTYDFTVDEAATGLDFGTVMVGQSNTLTVTIHNNGNDNINPVFTFNNNVFSIEDDSYPVYGGVSQQYEIIYTPTAVGTQNGVLTITVGNQSVTVNLTGKGAELAAYDVAVSQATNTEHNFGDVFKDGVGTWNLTIKNNGKNAVTPNLSGLEAPFSTTYAPAPIASGESATITFEFRPTDIQAYELKDVVLSFAEEGIGDTYTYTLRGNGIENTGTLPPSTYVNYSYTWTDDNGDEHTSAYSEIATDPNQMIALLKAIYTDKNMPGNYYRGYTATGVKDTQHEVAYPAIGAIDRIYDPVTRVYTHEFVDAYGWGMNHDETNYPITHSDPTVSGNYTITNYFLNPNEYKPNQEGLTLLLVEMNDGVGASTITTKPTDYASLKNIYSKMFKSVRVIPNSKRVSKNGVEGTLFKVDCDKMNRFFFLAKGRLRWYAGETGSSAYFRDQVKSSGSGSSYTWYDRENSIATVNPFNVMYEQFSPVSLSSGQASSDVYQELIGMNSYDVEHDCESIPWASANGVSGHEFNMYGKTSISADCQDVRDLMFFVPDERMLDWDGREQGTADMFVNYYQQNAPTMAMYVIKQNEISGDPTVGVENSYTLNLSWQSNLTDFVPGENGQYTIYQVNDDGSYTKVATVPSNQTTYTLDVAMQKHGQQVTYVIQGQDNTGFLSLQYSNEESFIIPGTNKYAKFQLNPRADFYSRYNPADEYNYYANGMALSGYADATSDMYVGKPVYFYRKPVTGTTEGEWTKFAEVTPSSATSASLTTFDQRTQAQYQYGYKQNAATLTIDGNVFTTFYDNFRADVSTNDHADYYKYIMVVDGTPTEIDSKYHSNEITVKVFKTKMSSISGSFDWAYVEGDDVRQEADKTTQFDVDVQHSSKTEVLRYNAYRWDSDDTKAILTGEEEDISPSGQASNHGEYYSVYMNGDSYIGQDVYVPQGQIGQATFVDDVPATAVDEYTYVPVVETFTGRSDYNTYGAPMELTATGLLGIAVGNKEQAGDVTWTANNKTYTYYNVFLDITDLEIPEGYKVAMVRAWRHIDPSYLGEQEGKGFEDRDDLDANGDYMFVTDGDKQYAAGGVLGDKVLVAEGSQYGQICAGTFGAVKLEEGQTIPMKFTVRIYFTKEATASPAPGLKAVNSADGKYYITEFEVEDELDSDVPTSIFGVVTVKEVARVKYYNMMGVESDVPFQGANIEVTTYTDGSRSSRKIMK